MDAIYSILFKYNYWANTKTIDAMEQAGVDSPQILKYMSHIIAAQQLWFARINHKEPDVQVFWPQWPIAECRSQLESSSQDWQNFLTGLSSQKLLEPCNYTNSKGIRFEAKCRDVIVHVLNHATHHRGQIMLELRQLNFEPPWIDYIAFTRENEEQPG